MNADELRADRLHKTLERMAESLSAVMVGVNVDLLETLDFPAAILDYVEAHNSAVFEADTQEHVLPVGIR